MSGNNRLAAAEVTVSGKKKEEMKKYLYEEFSQDHLAQEGSKEDMEKDKKMKNPAY